MELVIFKDLLEDDSEPQYGLLEEGDRPNILCLCCGGKVEHDDYVILNRPPWINFSSVAKKAQKNAN